MQKFVFCLLFVAFYFKGTAQQSRFIYIQTENKQPFYVKVDKKVFSSAASGYVIIPKLIDGTYNLSIGFPKNEAPVQSIQCSIDKKDQGYLLKNFGDKGWGLFNLQTLDVLMANNTSQSVASTVIKENTADTFSNMLSEVVKDPTIKQTQVIVETPKPSTAQEEQPKLEIVKPVEVAPAIETQKEIITRTLINTNAEGTEAVYVDKNGDDFDTIRIFIPAEKIIQQEIIETKKEVEKQTLKEEVVKAVEEPKQVIEAVKKETTSNPNCTNQATDEDFFKLRKKMAAEDTDDDMISVAKKVFKTKCFATAQIKNLSFLFLKDEGKYNFFDAAFTHVSDKKEYKGLQSELIDEYYINRFKVMIQ